jgi:uncharacterized protein
MDVNSSQELLKNQLFQLLFCFIAAVVTTTAAWIFGFFKKIQKTQNQKFPTLFLVIKLFIIYLFLAFFIGKITMIVMTKIISLLKLPTSEISVALLAWSNFIVLGIITYALIYIARRSDKVVFSNIWKIKITKHNSIAKDIFFSCYAWIIILPIVLLTSQIIDLFNLVVLNIEQTPDQLAVLFLKRTLGHPLYLTLAIISIVGFTPFLEEILFRGYLQTYLKKVLGIKASIAVASLTFALFHFSISQGLGNINIIITLFVLACFLGYLYERQKSLITPIMLHMIFNAISIINLFFFQGV